MKNLLTLIYSQLRTVADRVHIENAPSGITVVYPYVTYRIPTSIDDYQKQDFIVEIDIWDNKADNTAIEKLTDDIDAIFHRLQHYQEGVLQVSVYRINRMMIPDPDPKIRRRQLRYQAKTYIGA